jgi:glycosyltransferase involved in cell wall biosynthesis
MCLISVIIPVYNGAKTIRETIESVLKQTFTDFELIVINDGSTDATLDIISQFQDARIQVYCYPNAGLATSRNRGITQASGKYISFIDADDLWTPDKLELQLQALLDYPEAAVAYSWTDHIDENGQFLREGCHLSFNGNVYKNILLNDFIASGSNILIKHQALTEIGGFDEFLNYVEDWDMWIRLAAKYSFIVVPYPQILYRISTNSMSFNIQNMEKSSLKIIEKSFQQAPESIKYLKNISLANRYKYLTWKVFDAKPTRFQVVQAINYFWYAVITDPSLSQRKIFWKVLLKIAIIMLSPRQLALFSLSKMDNLANLDALLRLIKTQP